MSSALTHPVFYSICSGLIVALGAMLFNNLVIMPKRCERRAKDCVAEFVKREVIDTRLSSIEFEIKYIRQRLDTFINGKAIK